MVYSYTYTTTTYLMFFKKKHPQCDIWMAIISMNDVDVKHEGVVYGMYNKLLGMIERK